MSIKSVFGVSEFHSKLWTFY